MVCPAQYDVVWRGEKEREIKEKREEKRKGERRGDEQGRIH